MTNRQLYRAYFYRINAYTLCLFVLLPFLAACLGQPAPQRSNKQVPATQAPALVCSSHSSNPITLSMYYGSEKQAWMQDVVADFNNQHISACDGPITVSATPIG